jgi:hypothetical protein
VRSERQRHRDQEDVDGRVEDEALEGLGIGGAAGSAVEVDVRVPASEQAAEGAVVACLACIGKQRCPLVAAGRRGGSCNRIAGSASGWQDGHAGHSTHPCCAAMRCGAMCRAAVLVSRWSPWCCWSRCSFHSVLSSMCHSLVSIEHHCCLPRLYMGRPQSRHEIQSQTLKHYPPQPHALLHALPSMDALPALSGVKVRYPRNHSMLGSSLRTTTNNLATTYCTNYRYISSVHQSNSNTWSLEIISYQHRDPKSGAS